MNLSHLYYFRKLAEMEHYTNAAKELYITQPSLSAAISSLEMELGVELFKKEGRNVKLTKYGREFYGHVCKCLDELDKGIDEAKEHAGPTGGVIDVGCIPTMCGDFLPQSISRYKKEWNPTATFNVFSAYTKEIIEGIKNEVYDVGLCTLDEKEKKLRFVPIMKQEYSIIVAPKHPLAAHAGDFLNAEDLKPYQIVTYNDETIIGQKIKKSLEKYGLNVICDGFDENIIGGNVMFNHDVGFVAETSFLRQFDQMIHIKTNLVIDDDRKISLVYNPDRYLPPAVKQYIQSVTEYAENFEIY